MLHTKLSSQCISAMHFTFYQRKAILHTTQYMRPFLGPFECAVRQCTPARAARNTTKAIRLSLFQSLKATQNAKHKPKKRQKKKQSRSRSPSKKAKCECKVLRVPLPKNTHTKVTFNNDFCVYLLLTEPQTPTLKRRIFT